MYYLMSIEEITEFLSRFGIDFALFSPFEVSVTFILFNLYKIVAIFIVGYIIYRIALKIYDLVFGF